MNSLIQKLLIHLFVVGLSITVIASLSQPTGNSYYLFILLFLVLYWQRERLHEPLANRFKNPIRFVWYILFSLVWSLWLIITRGQPIFGNTFLGSFVVELGFYLPYFAFWYYLQKHQRYTPAEIFSLAGLSRILFEGTITRSLYLPLTLAESYGIATAVIAFGIKIVATFMIFGLLTLLPLAIFLPEAKRKSKSLKSYLTGLSSGFVAAIIFILWAGLLKNILQS